MITAQLATAVNDGTNGGNLMGWVIVYAPCAVALALVLRWANCRNRLLRDQLNRIEQKLDALTNQK